MLTLLQALQGPGRLEPGSRALQLGLNEHSPINVVDALTADDEALSVALHEVAHFHALDNAPGCALTLFGLLSNFLGDVVRSQLTTAAESDEVPMQAYLGWRSHYVRMLDAWRPLLEGLSVAVQLTPPCPQLDELVTPHFDLCSFESTIGALDARPGLDAPQRLLSAGYRAIRRGPQLGSSGETLAASLELNRGEDWLPYFLGTAYVRAVHDRLARKVPEFACPEVAINWLLRLLCGSGARLLGRDDQWDSPGAIERLYGWIELAERTPAARVREALELPWNVDVLGFLQTGEVRVGVSGEDDAYIAQVAEGVPRAWAAFRALLGQVDFDALALEAGDPLPRWRGDRGAALGAAAWFVSTQTLRICSGGTARLAGWIPMGVAGRHAVALRVGAATWWLALEEAQAARAPFDLSALPRLPSETLAEGRHDLAPTQQALSIGCFYTYTGYGLPRARPDDRRMPHWLIDLSGGVYPERPLLTSVIPGPGRALLAPVPPETTGALHRAAEELRADVSSRLAVSLEQIASVARRRRSHRVAEVVDAAARADRLACSRQRELWSRRILHGLLGGNVEPRARRAILDERMNGFIPDIAEVRELLPLAYGRPCAIDGPGRDRLVRCLEESANAAAAASIGKPLFAQGPDGQTVEYVGLWAKR